MRSPAPLSWRRRGVVGTLAATLVASPLALGLTSAADASVSTKISSYPYTQAWTSTGAISANDDWSGVTGVEGYLGQDITTTTGTDPRTLTAESTVANDSRVLANQTNTAITNGTVAEFDGIANPTIALQGSATADAPHVVFHLDLTGRINVTFAYTARDIDATTDDAVQQVALQYRVGAAGAYTNLADGYIADATTTGAATQSTTKTVSLPAAVNGASSVFVRVLTTNAAGNDEWVGIDDVSVTADAGTSALNVTNPGPQTGTVGTAITPLQIGASGGTSPYTVVASNLPAGLTYDADTDTVSGTPTTAGTTTVQISVTDGAGGTDTDSFSWTIAEPAAPIAIAAIQGTGTTTPLSGQTVTARGVVTAAYPMGGLNGFYMQTPGADTANASDAIFVWGGSGGFAEYPAIGDSVEATGVAGESSGQTQINATAGSVTPVSALGTVTPKTAIPGTGCALPGTDCPSLATLAPDREVMEGELVKPTSAFTVTDSYDGSAYWPGVNSSSGMFGEIGLAAGDQPLVTPTELYDTQTQAAQLDARVAYNNARRIILDDGSSLNYAASGANSGQAFPWFTATHSVRVGAAVTFPQPVVFTEGFGSWRVLPTTRVVGEPTASQPQIAQTRASNQAPIDVGGDVKLATFNVLNFFPTTGEEYVNGGGKCTYYTDRQNNPITTNECGTPTAASGNGPRGAANDASVQRQRDKIVAAITTSGATVVSLEELENSAKFGKDRDFAIGKLVDALNIGTPGKWAFVPSPTGADLPPLADEDLIRTGFIYQPARVAPVGTSKILVGSAAFTNAREPLAQAFKTAGASDADAFGVVVNHFKSKGSACSSGNDPIQGNCNGDRVNQANALVAFADQFKADRSISKVFLAGDYNSYAQEDPMQVLASAGYTNLESHDPTERSYSFDGQVGSLDHVLANDAALATVDKVDSWQINSVESVYYEYSRFNSNVTNLYTNGPFRSSDHNPEIVGIKTSSTTQPPAPAIDTTVTGTAAPVDYGQAASVAVKVAPATATGTVTLSLAGTVIGSTTLTSGAGTIAVPVRALPPGTYTLALSYSGDAGHKASTGTVTHVVTKATPTLTAKAKPKVVKPGKGRVKIVVRVEADGFVPTGKVRVRVAGKVYRARVVDGKAVVKLKKIGKPGRYKAKVRYLGDANTEAARTTAKFRVKRR